MTQRQQERHTYLLGIGGSGLSALAGYLIDRGERVTGSDRRGSDVVTYLRSRGARIHVGEPGVRLDRDLDLIVYTAAASPDHDVLREASEAGIPTLKYAEFLGQEIAGRPSVAVAGTHGKTTTAGWIAHLLTEAGQDPSVIIGGAPCGAAGPGRGGSGPVVVEACEYDHSFLSLRPQAAVLTNVEADHLDYFGTEDGVLLAFQDFLAQLEGHGPLVLHESAARRLDLSAVRRRVAVVGKGRGVTDRLTLLRRAEGSWCARLEVPGHRPVELRPSLPGDHNLQNAAVSAAIALRLGVDEAQVEAGVSSFPGMVRRMEPLGCFDGVQWYSDYAHHPTELRALRQALRTQWAGARLWLVFQPHQAGRTRRFLQDFARELAAFDEVVLPGIFSVREDRSLVQQTEAQLVSALSALGCTPRTPEGLDAVMPELRDELRPGDVVALAGAGDIDELARALRSVKEEASVARVG